MSSVVRFTTRHAALLPLLLSPLAGAQESPAAPVTLDRITVSGEEAPAYAVRETGAATRLDLAPRETPQSLSIVTRQQLDDQNLQSLRDVLDQTSGIYSYAYDSERVVFSSRGFIIDNLMYDGLPAASNFATESLDDNLDTALYERIEIVRGANGLMMGAGNPSAAVNLVRKRADQRSFTGDLNLSYGSWDNARASADFATRLNASGSIRARAIGVYQHRESYQDLYQKEKGVLYGVIDADLSPHTLLTLGYDLQNTMPQANTWGSFPLFFSDGSLSNWPRSVTTATRWSFWDKRKQSFFGELRHDFDNGWQARAALNRRSFKEDLALFYVYGFPDPQTGEGLVPFAYREKVKTTQNAADAYARGPFQWFGRRHELVLGASASKLYIKGNEYQHGALAEVGNFFDWDGRYPQPEFSSTPTPDSDIEVRQTGLYAAARLSLADPLKLILGARRSGFKNDYYYLYSGAPFAQQRNKLVPYAGALYELNASYSAFVSYTAIFNPQNKREYDGTYLQPLQGKSYETGIKGEHFGGRFNTALTLFETRLDHVAENALDASGNQLYVLDDGRTPAASSVDGTRTRGFEAQANGTLRENWNLSLGFSRYILQGPDHGEIRTYIPRTLIRGFSSWTPALAQRQLTVGAGANWQSSSHVTVGAPSGAVDMQQSPVTLLSLMARWQFTPQLSVQLNGDNLLDQTYYVLDEYGNLYYGTPLNATATLRYRF